MRIRVCIVGGCGWVWVGDYGNALCLAFNISLQARKKQPVCHTYLYRAFKVWQKHNTSITLIK